MNNQRNPSGVLPFCTKIWYLDQWLKAFFSASSACRRSCAMSGSHKTSRIQAWREKECEGDMRSRLQTRNTVAHRASRVNERRRHLDWSGQKGTNIEFMCLISTKSACMTTGITLQVVFDSFGQVAASSGLANLTCSSYKSANLSAVKVPRVSSRAVLKVRTLKKFCNGLWARVTPCNSMVLSQAYGQTKVQQLSCINAHP